MPKIDGLSFALGFVTACGLFFILFLFRKQLGEFRDLLSQRFRRLREYLTAGLEQNLREDMLRFAQTQHLAGPLFPLDSILLPPRVLRPEPPFDPANPDPDDDSVEAIIPVLPEWPDLAAIYKAPTILAEEAIKAGNLLVLGAPGTGKSTALAHLVTQLARGQAPFLPADETLTPLFIHAADLPLPRLPTDDVAQPLVAAVINRVSLATAPRVGRHLRSRLAEYKYVILLDGLDEVPARNIIEIAQWLAEFQKTFPLHQWVAAAGTQGYGPILNLGFAPVVIAPWSGDDFKTLMVKWREAWEALQATRKKRPANEVPADAQLIMGWFSTGNAGRSVYEITLKIWGALAGDTRGKRPVDWLETYLQRFGLKALGYKAVGRLAVAVMARDDYLGLARQDVTTLLDPLFLGPDGKPVLDTDDFLDDLMARRLLVRHARDRLSFNHTFIMAYCAAQALLAEPEAITPAQTPAWTRSLYFYTNLGDITPIVAHYLSQPPDLMFSDLLACAIWLRDAPPTAKWRSDIFRRLSVVFMDPRQTESLRLRALAGFVAASDPAVGALFKPALNNPDPFTRRLAVLGLGALGDLTAIPQLASRFTDDYLDVRWAASLALGAMNNTTAIETLRQGLTTGDDTLRRACAEALARHPEQGHPILQDSLNSQDIATRRAAVYGFAAINEPWAIEVVDKMQHVEQQWLVRSAIQETLDRAKDTKVVLPQPAVAPESQGWLIEWAAQQGLGVPPGDAALDVLNRALKEGDAVTQRAAMDSLGRLANPHGARELYPLLRSQDALLREMAFRALANISLASAQRLSLPVN